MHPASAPPNLPLYILLNKERKNRGKRICVLHALWKTQESRGQWASASHFVGRHLQPLDNNGLETTLRPRRSCLCSGNGGPLSQAATPPVPFCSKSQKQPAGAITWHISIQFPLQNVFIFRLMACHFAGAFGQELILESKQIFRGAIFHQVLIFLHSRSLYSLI